jgi:DNA-binding NarL/FixJ family response regulator
MVAYRLDGIAGSRTHASGHAASQIPKTVAEYIAETRATANEVQHPIAVFDVDGQPVFRNSALASRLSAEQQALSSHRTWQQIYASACRIVSEAIAGRTGISTVISIQQRSYVILGSLLRQASGTVYGAAVHISEVKSLGGTAAGSAVGQVTHISSDSSAADENYRAWILRRDEARSRMQRLSPRELEVVSRVSAGLPNKSIARELEISVKTIEKHRANAVRKLGVQSTPEMVRIAVLADPDQQNASVLTDTSAMDSQVQPAVPKPVFTQTRTPIV